MRDWLYVGAASVLLLVAVPVAILELDLEIRRLMRLRRQNRRGGMIDLG